MTGRRRAERRTRRGATDARSRHRRHRPLADRPRRQGLARRASAPTTWPRRSCAPRWTRCPQLDPHDIDDLMLGCGQPGGESGLQHRPRRRRAARLRLPARHDRQPLLLVVAADDPDGLPRDQGRRGRRVHLRRRRDGLALRQGQLRRPGPTRTTRCFAEAEAAHRQGRRERRRRLARPARGRRRCPTSTSRWARPPRTWPCSRASPARSMDEFGVRSQNLAEKAHRQRLLGRARSRR